MESIIDTIEKPSTTKNSSPYKDDVQDEEETSTISTRQAEAALSNAGENAASPIQAQPLQPPIPQASPENEIDRVPVSVAQEVVQGSITEVATTMAAQDVGISE